MGCVLCSTALVAATLLAACGTESTDHEPSVSFAPEVRGVAEVERFALVVLTYSEKRDEFRIPGQLDGVGWFFEHAEFTREDVLDLLNVPLVGERAPAAVDACELHVRGTPSEHLDVESDTGWVYFMDAGEVAVEAGRRGMVLDSLYYPDIYPTISGIVYDGSNTRGRSIVVQPEVHVVGHGSSEVGEFAVTLTPPEPIHLARVGERPVRSPRVQLTEPDGALDVKWSRGSRRGRDADATMVVEYVRQSFDREASIVCTVEDDGAFSFDAELLAQLPELGPDQIDRISAARYATEPFEADGLEAGQAVFITRDSVLVQRP